MFFNYKLRLPVNLILLELAFYLQSVHHILLSNTTVMSRSTEEGAPAHGVTETEPVACDIELEGVTCTGSLVHDMKFAFHGDRLAAACIDHSVKVYEDTGHGTWELRSEWKAHKAPVLRVGWVCSLSCRSTRCTGPVRPVL